MTETESTATESQATAATPTALLVIPGGGGKSEKALSKFLQMILEYRFGLGVELVSNVRHVARLLQENKEGLHSIYLIQGQPVSTRSTVPILTAQGTLPLFILQPKRVAEEQRVMCEGLEGVHVCAWETAFGHTDACLARVVARGLADRETVGAGQNAQDVVRQRLEKLDTLPSLPSVVGRLIKLIEDPNSTIAELEVILDSDPAIALKVRQVANSAAVAGASGNSVTTLKEAITRLGTRKIGAIAQQIALINSMVQPDTSDFDLRKFWGHSLACAIVADRIHDGEFVDWGEERLSFSDYWLAALLHDCGKAVQGFFFWDWFECISETMEEKECSFYEAENELGDGLVTHDQISEMMMQKAEMPEELVEAVGLHHEPGKTPSRLVALIHVADALCNEMGFGYSDHPKVTYERGALKALGLKRQTMSEMAETLREPVAREIMEIVSQCLGDET